MDLDFEENETKTVTSLAEFEAAIMKKHNKKKEIHQIIDFNTKQNSVAIQLKSQP